MLWEHRERTHALYTFFPWAKDALPFPCHVYFSSDGWFPSRSNTFVWTTTKNFERSGYYAVSINKPRINLNSFTLSKKRKTYDCDTKFISIREIRRTLISKCFQKDQISSVYPGWRRRQWHPTPVLLPGKSYGRRSLVGCSPWGCEESDMTERLHFHFSLLCIGEGNGNLLQCSCLENPRDGVAQSWTQL